MSGGKKWKHQINKIVLPLGHSTFGSFEKGLSILQLDIYLKIH